MNIYNLKDKPEYIKEFVLTCHNEWGNTWNDNEKDEKLQTKINNTIKRLNNYPTIILLDKDILVGFISLFEHDGLDKNDLTPWYATMYVKKEYRGKHISKILNDEIINEAKRLKYEKIYLKTTLINFYEKYGWIFLEESDNKENIYFLNLNENN